MYTVGYKHHFDKQSNWYAVYARQANKAGGHYDLGASGHGITTDCKDASGVPGVSGSNCFTGETLQAGSVGWVYRLLNRLLSPRPGLFRRAATELLLFLSIVGTDLSTWFSLP